METACSCTNRETSTDTSQEGAHYVASVLDFSLTGLKL